MNRLIPTLDAACKEKGILLTKRMQENFKSYAEFLVEYNKNVNLTRITEPEEIAVKHFLDSIMLSITVDIKKGARVADVGCGAGFPSVPLKIVRSDIELTLIDALNKRVEFLKKLLDLIGQSGQAIHMRGEEAGRTQGLREEFDLVTARAVAQLPELCEYCLPLVKKGGRFAALKGADCDEEVASAERAISLLGGKIEDIKKFSLPDGSGRSVIIIKKISQTPTEYPRPSAKISKKSL